MSEYNNWNRARTSRISRRTLLKATGRAGVGAAGLALVGCGDDDDDDSAATAATEQAEEEPEAQAQAQAEEEPEEQAQAQAEEEPEAQAQAEEEPEAQAQAQAEEQAEEQAVARGGHLIWGTRTSFETWRGPYRASGQYNHVVGAFWDTLIKYSEDSLEPVPHLAESWEFNDDQTALHVKLRPGLEFHNGKPLDAEAVKASMELISAEGTNTSQVKGVMKYIASIDVVDAITMTFNLAWPGPLIFDLFEYATVHDPDDLVGYQNLESLNGSGAFKFNFDEFKPGESFLGERHENFWSPANLDSIEWRVFQDQSTIGLALEAGEIHATDAALHADFLRLQDDDDFVLRLSNFGSGMNVLGMVTTNNGGGHPALDDPRVRRAIFRSVDKQALVDNAFSGVPETANFYWPTFSDGYDPELDRDYYNPEEARALMQESGWEGEEIPLVARIGNANENAIAQVIQAQAIESGINFVIAGLEGAERGERFVAGTLPGCYVGGFGFYHLQPETLANINFQMRIPNSCAYETPEYAAVIDALGAAPSAARRAELIADLNTIYAREPWIVPLSTTSWVYAWSKNVTGWKFDVDMYMDMHSLALNA